MKSTIGLNQVGAPCLNRDSLSGTAQFQSNIQASRNNGANIYILSVWSESLDSNGEMVRVERDVGNGKSARAVREDRAIIAANRIMYFNTGAGNHGVGGIGNHSLQRSAGSLGGSLDTKEKYNADK